MTRQRVPEPALSALSVATHRVQLMATCLSDGLFPEVARATVEVLEHLGVEVGFPEDQTCCAQPAFNAGDWPAARRVARHTLQVFSGDAPIVVPSGSCARMLSHGGHLLFEREADRPAAESLGARTWELADFIVRARGVTTWPGRLAARLAFHRSCHSRGSQYAESALKLLRSIDGATVVEVGEAEQCCGFGGTFSIAFPRISRGMGDLKLDQVFDTGANVLVSADSSCLMHLSGLAAKEGRALRTMHVAEVLRDALASPPAPPPPASEHSGRAVSPGER